jgi:cyclohexanone monooxygenase
MRVLAIEAGSGVGGTWYWNRYPGARCDSPSLQYCYTFSPELLQEWTWTERYAAQPEILSYLNHVADRFDLRRDIRFDTRITAAHWDQGAGVWHVTTDKGDEFSAHYLVTAAGCLSHPKLPHWPGIETFSGPVYHTSQWPQEKVRFAGKRVGVVGTGSSGIQIVPEIAREAAHLTVFQRTPSFAVPAGNRPADERETRETKAQYETLWEGARKSFLGFFGAPGTGSAAAAPRAEREETFERAWNAGTTGLLQAYEDLLVNAESNEAACEFARGKIRRLVKDPETARRMTPHGYPLGARRMCAEIGYFDTMNRPNVTLVDVRETPILSVDATGVTTTERHHALDIMVMATGFQAVTGALAAIDIRGRDGKSLREEWEDGPRTYLGLAVSGFPNLFTITGPGSPSVISNMPLSIEQHVEWIANCIADLERRGASRIEATKAAQDDWMKHVEEVANATLFPRANAWYQARTRDGRNVFMPYVGGVGRYRERCESIAGKGYTGFTITN